MLNLDLTSLRLFVAVCEAGSISKVASEEAMVVSAISKRMAQLEHELGARLLDRQHSGVHPTPEGLALLDRTAALLAVLQDIERDFDRRRQSLRGQVRVFAAAATLADSIPDDITGFLRNPEHQDIRVCVEEQLSHDVAEGVRTGAAPLGICWDAADLSGLHTRTYRMGRLGVVVAADHELAGRKSIRFAETLKYPHIGLSAASNFQSTLREAARVASQVLRYRVIVATFDAATRLARSGVGVAIIPREIALRSQAAEDGTYVPLEDAWAQRRFVLCCRDPDMLPTAARRLHDYLCGQTRSS